MRIIRCDFCGKELCGCERPYDWGGFVHYPGQDQPTKTYDVCDACDRKLLDRLSAFAAEGSEKKEEQAFKPPFTREELKRRYGENDYALVGYAVNFVDGEVFGVLVDQCAAGMIAVWNADGYEPFLEEDYGSGWAFFEDESSARAYAKKIMEE